MILVVTKIYEKVRFEINDNSEANIGLISLIEVITKIVY